MLMVDVAECSAVQRDTYRNVLLCELILRAFRKVLPQELEHCGLERRGSRHGKSGQNGDWLSSKDGICRLRGTTAPNQQGRWRCAEGPLKRPS